MAEKHTRMKKKGQGLQWGRVLRGGSWNNNNNDNFRCSYRNNNNPDNRNNNNGFRSASTELQPESGCLWTTGAGKEESRPFPGSG
jgi:hypothetical protein